MQPPYKGPMDAPGRGAGTPKHPGWQARRTAAAAEPFNRDSGTTAGQQWRWDRCQAEQPWRASHRETATGGWMHVSTGRQLGRLVHLAGPAASHRRLPASCHPQARDLVDEPLRPGSAPSAGLDSRIHESWKMALR